MGPAGADCAANVAEPIQREVCWAVGVLQHRQRIRPAVPIARLPAETTLVDLPLGERAEIRGFRDIDSRLAQRLMQLGVIEGEAITPVRTAPGGDPVEYRIMGYALSLRRAEAAQVMIRRSSASADG